MAYVHHLRVGGLGEHIGGGGVTGKDKYLIGLGQLRQ